MNAEDNGEIIKVVEGSAINFIGHAFATILGLVFVLVLTRFLSPTEVGLYYLGFSIVNILSIIAQAGTPNGLRRFISIYHGRGDTASMHAFFKTALWVSIPLVLLLATMMFLGCDVIAKRVFSKPELGQTIRIMAFYLPFFTLPNVLVAVTQGMKYMQYKVYCLDVANVLLKMTFTLLFFIFGYKLFGALIALVIIGVFITFQAAYYVHKVFPKYTGKKRFHFGELLNFSLPQTFVSLLMNLQNMSGTLMLGFFATAASVGIFQISLKIVLLGASILLSFNTMLAPMISDLHTNGRKGELEILYKTVTKWVITLALPFFLLMILMPVEFVSLFGKEYATGWLCLVILSVAQIVNSGAGPAGLMILMTGRVYITLANTSLSLLVSLSLCYLLIPRFDYVGAAVGIAGSVIVVNILRLVAVYRLDGMMPYQGSIYKPFASALPASLALLAVKSLFSGWHNVILLVLCGMMFFIVYIWMTLILGIDKTDRFVFEKIKRKLFGTLGPGTCSNNS